MKEYTYTLFNFKTSKELLYLVCRTLGDTDEPCGMSLVSDLNDDVDLFYFDQIGVSMLRLEFCTPETVLRTQDLKYLKIFVERLKTEGKL